MLGTTALHDYQYINELLFPLSLKKEINIQ